MSEREVSRIDPKGLFRVTPVALDRDGRELRVPITEAISARTKRWLGSSRLKAIGERVVKGNLVVNTGRSHCARSFTQGFNRYISYLQLGDCTKSANPPSLLDVGVVQEVRTLAGATGGTFLIDQDTEVFEPAAARRFPIDLNLFWGSTAQVVIDGDGTTRLVDVSQDFSALGVQFTDTVVFNTPSLVPVSLAVKQVLSTTELELHNPHGYAAVGVAYRIENPGTQVLFSKLITGDTHFPASTYGPAVLIHESSLLFNDGVAWNRVLYAAHDDTLGVLIQPSDAFGTQLGARFEALITI